MKFLLLNQSLSLRTIEIDTTLMMTIIVMVTQLVNGKITTTITIMDIGTTTTPIQILILTPTPMLTTTITIVTEQILTTMIQTIE